MKKSGLLLFLAVLILSIVSCDDTDCNCPEEIYGKWEAIYFGSLESHHYFKVDDYNPVIEFNVDKTIDIKLDVNSCFADFRLSGKSDIDISVAGCTEACCDSEFSEKFAGKLSNIRSYQIDKDTLRLEDPDWGFIRLERISD